MADPDRRREYLDSEHARTLRRWLGWVLERHASHGGRTELRLIRRTGKRSAIYSGLFGPDDLDDLVVALAPLPDGPRKRIPREDHPRIGEANVYFSLHAIKAELGEGREPRITRSATTAKDRDVAAYTLFAVDIDPVREAGVSSTDEEKRGSLDVAERVRAWLLERGVASALADSGNGHHLLVPVVVSAGDEAVRRAATDAHDLLKLLHERFSTPEATVDTAVANPSRIFKVYGSLAVKGSPTEERPHRFATVDVDELPPDTDLFSVLGEEIEAFRARRRPASTQGPSSSRQRDGVGSSCPPEWKAWREEALRQLDLQAVYGELLTGRTSGAGWLQCRDPQSPSGDKNPSASVADGTGDAERAAFHSFRSGRTISVFDFLVENGRAADFAGACKLVGELSGVPLPERERRLSTRAPAIDELRRRWEGEDPGRRAALVREVIARLLELPAIERDPLLKEVRAITGLSSRVFRETVSEVRRARKERPRASATPPQPARAGLQVVDYVTNRDSVDGLFDALVSAVLPAERLFSTGAGLTYVDPGVGPVVVHDKNLGGLLASLVEIRFLTASDDGLSFNRYGVLPADLARAFVASPRVRRRLPTLEMYARAPMFDRDWRFIGRPGFHPCHGIFYDGPEVRPVDGVARLCEVLADFHWKAEADLVNFVGALVTAITMPHWGRGHPFLAINGNKPGVGKSTLARTLGVIVEGTEPNTVSYTHDDAEFEKQLATRVEAGDRVIIIDNAKTRRSIESAVLERCISDTRLNFRRLGSNTAISRPVNDLLICLTMNLTHLGADLRRRALPVNLELDASVRAASYKRPDLVGFVLRHRLEVVAELAGMVVAWVEAGRPRCEEPARHSTSQVWAGTVDAILRLGGFDGFLTNFESSEHAFDPRYQLMADICREHHAKPAATASRWAEWLADGLLEERFKDRRGNPKSARAKATIVGSLFTEYLDQAFTVDGKKLSLHRAYPDGPTHSAVYQFREGA